MIYISGTAEATNLKFGNQNSRSAYQISQRAGAHGHRDRLGKCGDERNAPAFQPHGHRDRLGKCGDERNASAFQPHGHRDRLGKCGDERNAPAFQPHGHRPERLLCHVFEGSSTDEEAIVSQLLLPQTICTLP